MLSQLHLSIFSHVPCSFSKKGVERKRLSKYVTSLLYYFNRFRHYVHFCCIRLLLSVTNNHRTQNMPDKRNIRAQRSQISKSNRSSNKSSRLTSASLAFFICVFKKNERKAPKKFNDFLWRIVEWFPAMHGISNVHDIYLFTSIVLTIAFYIERSVIFPLWYFHAKNSRKKRFHSASCH